MKRKIFFLLLFYIGNIYLYSTSGTNAFEFVNLGIGCKEIGLGEQGVALSKGVNALYWNPAGILENGGVEVSFMYNKWFQGINEQFVGGIIPFRKYTLGLGIYKLGVEPFQGYDNFGNEADDVESNSLMASFVFSKNLGPVRAGLSLKSMQETLDDVSASSFGIDFGVRGNLTNRIKIGIGAQNFISQKVKFIKDEFPVPLVYRVGVSYERNILKEDNLILGVEGSSVSDEDFNISIGAEYFYKNLITLRIGYLNKQDIGSKIRAGLGLKLRNWQVDYAFADYGDLGDTHRFSITWYYGEWKENLIKSAEIEKENILKKIDKFMKKGKYLEAVVEIEKLLKKYPDDKKLINLLKEAGSKINK